MYALHELDVIRVHVRTPVDDVECFNAELGNAVFSCDVSLRVAMGFLNGGFAWRVL